MNSDWSTVSDPVDQACLSQYQYSGEMVDQACLSQNQYSGENTVFYITKCLWQWTAKDHRQYGESTWPND